MSEWVEGRVTRVLWCAEDRGWAVLSVNTTDGMPTIVVGPLAPLADRVDETPFASFEGKWVRHPSHGHQFRADAYLQGSPRTSKGVELYLASAGIPGVGKTLAKRLVAHFGEDITGVLEAGPEQLTEVRGISKARAEAISEAWQGDAGQRSLTILLRGLGVSLRLAEKIREAFGDRAADIVRRRPYELTQKVRGVGFITADRIALSVGIAKDAPERQEAAIVYLLRRRIDEGSCWVSAADLHRSLRDLGVPSLELEERLHALSGEQRVVLEGHGPELLATTPALDRAERSVALHLLLRQQLKRDVPMSDVEIAAVESRGGLTLDETQRKAVSMALGGGVSVITGGPGTGKTTLVKVLVTATRELGESWALASPTGRASRRLSEATGQEAKTLHRLLEFNPSTFQFERNSTQPLEVDGVVVDEASMVDVRLMAALLDALPVDRPCSLVLVGDADQLPSVGPGQVLKDLVSSGRLPVTRLTTIHRQGEDSGIVLAARAVHEGRAPNSGERSGRQDFFWVERSSAEEVVRTLMAIVKERLPAKGFQEEQIQVLTPTRKGPLGTYALNEALQQALNPDGKPVTGSKRHGFRSNDRVICTKNRYDLNVFNGDVGRIVPGAGSVLTIRFEQETVQWPIEDLDQLELAYAVTVHKSQGSEYRAVVLVLHRSHSIMLRRNLVYTAITRGKQFFCGLGDAGALTRAVQRTGGGERTTRLQERMFEQSAEFAGEEPWPSPAN